MKIITRKYKVFNFNELKDEAKDRVIEDLRYINVDHSWFDMDEGYNEVAKKYGLKIIMGEVCFDLDRDNYCYFETYNHGGKKDYEKGIYIADYKKFVKKAGLKLNKRFEDSFVIEHKHYAGGVGKNFIADNYGYDLKENELEKLENCLESFIDKILKGLKDDYNYLTSRESIIETIEANDYEFLESGKLF